MMEDINVLGAAEGERSKLPCLHSISVVNRPCILTIPRYMYRKATLSMCVRKLCISDKMGLLIIYVFVINYACKS